MYYVQLGSWRTRKGGISLCDLFYDFDAFGSLIDARPHIKRIVNAHARELNIANPNAPRRKIVTGPNPQILYFTGKTEMVAAETELGRISASHNPGLAFPSPNGVHVKNTITVSIGFKEPLIFEETIARVATVIRYLEILIGRPQSLVGLTLRIRSNKEMPLLLNVYWSMPPKRDASREWREPHPHPSDVLLSPVQQPQEFSRVLINWLGRENELRPARLRFSESFAEQKHYDINRLIACANVFDILPSSAVPADVPISAELAAAKKVARSKFRSLVPSPERDSVLNALGRVGKSNLKQKIRYRVQRIMEAVEPLLPQLLTDTAEAVPELLCPWQRPSVRLQQKFRCSDLFHRYLGIRIWCLRPHGSRMGP